jgi:hypothetical protein
MWHKVFHKDGALLATRKSTCTYTTCGDLLVHTTKRKPCLRRRANCASLPLPHPDLPRLGPLRADLTRRWPPTAPHHWTTWLAAHPHNPTTRSTPPPFSLLPCRNRPEISLTELGMWLGRSSTQLQHACHPTHLAAAAAHAPVTTHISRVGCNTTSNNDQTT